MDNVPGGTIDATGLLYSSITGEDLGGPRSFWEYPAASITNFYLNHVGDSARWETNVIKPDQCFIPTYSSIGIKNPNQSWSNPLNRNLVCDPDHKEIYFDSYFGEANNTPHVELNYRSVNWLLKEIGTDTTPPIPQAPYFPIQAGSLTGPDVVCYTANTVYSLDVCKVPSPVKYNDQNGNPVNGWSVTPNLTIISSTPYSITVTGNHNGSGTITATFQNGQTITKTIWVGLSAFNLVRDSQETCDGIKYHYVKFIIDLHGQAVTGLDLTYDTVPATTLTYGQSSANTYTFKFLKGYQGDIHFNVIATNSCGSYMFDDTQHISACSSLANRSAPDPLYRIYPNPSSDIVNIGLFDQNLAPDSNLPIMAQLYDMMGQKRGEVEVINNVASLSVAGLPLGIYVLKINIDGEIESHQVSVQ
jgi:hypothetical protein